MSVREIDKVSEILTQISFCQFFSLNKPWILMIAIVNTNQPFLFFLVWNIGLDTRIASNYPIEYSKMSLNLHSLHFLSQVVSEKKNVVKFLADIHAEKF